MEVLAGLLRRDNWRKIRSVDVILMCHDVDRAYGVDGLPYSQLLDPIRQQLEEQGIVCATVAHRFSRLTGRRAWGNPLSINRASLVNVLADRAGVMLGRKTADRGASKRSIRFWERLLARSDAKLVLLIGAPPEVCIAARRRSVPVVELLHGFRYASVPWGYQARSSASLPRYIFALDEISRSTFSYLESGGVQVVLVGTQSLADWVDTDPVSSCGDEALEPHGFLGGRPTVLIALQWGYCDGEIAGGRFANGLFPNALTQAIYKSTGNLNWIIRLHPVQMRRMRMYREQIALVRRLQELPHVMSMEYSQQPLSLLLACSDVLLTPSSGTASEALGKGVPVVFFDPDPLVRNELAYAYSNEMSAGMARFWECANEDIESFLAEVLKSSGITGSSYGAGPKSAVDTLLFMLRNQE